MIDPTSFAGTAIAALLEGEHPVLQALRRQAAGADVRAVEASDYGVWIDLWVPDGVPPIDVEHRFAIDDVFGRVAGVAEDTGLQLHVVRGRIKTIEAWVSQPVWPADPVLESTWYVVWDRAAAEVVRVPVRDEDFAVRGMIAEEEDD